MDADANLTLRTALPSDRAFLLALYASTRADEFAQLGWPAETEHAFMKMQFDAQRGDYEHRHPGASCQVVEWHRCPVGRLWVAHDARSLTVLDISLVTELRGQGIGTECLRRVLRLADSARLDVELQVVRGNPAQHLYGRLGFVPVGAGDVRVAMVRKPIPAHTLNKEMHHEQA